MLSTWAPSQGLPERSHTRWLACPRMRVKPVKPQAVLLLQPVVTQASPAPVWEGGLVRDDYQEIRGVKLIGALVEAGYHLATQSHALQIITTYDWKSVRCK